MTSFESVGGGPRFKITDAGQIHDAETDETFDLTLVLDGREVTLSQLVTNGDERASEIAQSKLADFQKNAAKYGVPQAKSLTYKVITTETPALRRISSASSDLRQPKKAPPAAPPKDVTLEGSKKKTPPAPPPKETVPQGGTKKAPSKSPKKTAADTDSMPPVSGGAASADTDKKMGTIRNRSLAMSQVTTAEEPTESTPAKSGAADFSEITQDYQYKNHNYGKRTIKRRSSISDIKKMADAKIAELDKLMQGDLSSVEMEKLQSKKTRMQRLKNSADLYFERTGRDWVNSQFWRDALELALAPHLNSPTACEAIYTEMCDDFFPAAVNMRTQRYEIAGQPVRHVVRGGVITDLRNNMTHLGELEAMTDEGATGAAARKAFEDRLTTIENKHAEKAKTPGVQAGIAHARAQVSSKESLAAAIADRREALETQMLQLLSGHIEANPDLVLQHARLPDAEIPMMHVGLLRETAVEVRKNSPWVQVEANETEDMKRIFEEFDGKTIVFDGTGPFIDEDGKVHLPLEDLNEHGQPRQAKLKTFYANVCVQRGDGAKLPRQLKINSDAEASLQSYFRRVPAEMRKGFQAAVGDTQSDFDAATQLVHGAVITGILTSTGCQQGKDRTGCVCEGVGFRLMEEGKDFRTLPKKTRDKRMDRIAYGSMIPGAIAASVTEDNTGVRYLKIDPRQRIYGMSRMSQAKLVSMQGRAMATGGYEAKSASDSISSSSSSRLPRPSRPNTRGVTSD